MTGNRNYRYFFRFHRVFASFYFGHVKYEISFDFYSRCQLATSVQMQEIILSYASRVGCERRMIGGRHMASLGCAGVLVMSGANHY